MSSQGSKHVFPHPNDFKFPDPLIQYRTKNKQTKVVQPRDKRYRDDPSSNPSGRVDQFLKHVSLDAKKEQFVNKDVFVERTYYRRVINKSRAKASVKFKLMLQDLLFSSWLQTFIMIAIFFNTIMICLETNAELKARESYFFQIAENVCLMIFVIEIALKMVYDIVEFWLNFWNVFDFVVVGVSLVGTSLPFVSSIRILRVLRVVRSIRILRAVSIAPQLQQIFSAFVNSWVDIGNVMVLVIIFMLVCAFIGVAMFGNASPTWFGDLGKAMYSLVILLTMDGWLDMYYELRDKGETVWAMIYIYAVILIGANIFVNILVGVSVNGLNMMQADYANAEKAEKFLDTIPAMTVYDANEPMRTPPIPSDTVWETQKPLEIPKFGSVSPHVLAKFYILHKTMRKTLDDIENAYNETRAIANRNKSNGYSSATQPGSGV